MSFDNNLDSLKEYYSKGLPREDAQHILTLIRLNDLNLEYQTPPRLREYLRIRNKILNNSYYNSYNNSYGSVVPHLESIRRKKVLEEIKEEALRISYLNTYINYLLEERKAPLNTLLSNLEYSEAYAREANRELKRDSKCGVLKRVGKYFVCFLFMLLFYKIIKIFY